MWQLFSIGSSFFTALEETIDKANIVSQKAIGMFTATFIRNAAYLAIALLAPLIFTGHVPQVAFTPLLLALGITNAAYSLGYTFLLRRLEVSVSGIFSNLLPIIFLIIDILIFHRVLLSRQIAGIVFLVVGGSLFVFHSSARKLTRRQTWTTVGIFIFGAFYYGFEAYLFQSYAMHRGMSEVSFLVSAGVSTILVLLLAGAVRMMLSAPSPKTKLVVHYSAWSLLSKMADYSSAALFLYALARASVSQVSAMGSLYPMILLVVVIVIQKGMRVNLEEVLDRNTAWLKICAVVVMSLGVFLVQ